MSLLSLCLLLSREASVGEYFGIDFQEMIHELGSYTRSAPGKLLERFVYKTS